MMFIQFARSVEAEIGILQKVRNDGLHAVDHKVLHNTFEINWIKNIWWTSKDENSSVRCDVLGFEAHSGDVQRGFNIHWKI